MKRVVSVVIVLILLLGITPAYAAEDVSGWDKAIKDFFAQHNIDPETVSLAYYNTVTGEEHYHNPDVYMTAASVSKVPLNMYYAEKVASGEIGWDTFYGGVQYSYIQEVSLRYSNNDLSTVLIDNIGTFADYRRAICPYMGEDASAMDYRFFLVNEFTAAQMMHCMKTLYSESDRFPGVLEHMGEASPGEYFEEKVSGYEIAQKYGWYVADYHNYVNCAGVVYTEEPILLVIFTDNCSISYKALGEYCEAMCEYTESTIQARIAAEKAAEAERLAAEEEAARLAAEEQARLEAEAEKEAAGQLHQEMEEPAEELDSKEQSPFSWEKVRQRLTPLSTAVLVLVVVFGIILVLLSKNEGKLLAFVISAVICYAVLAAVAVSPEISFEKADSPVSVENPEVPAKPDTVPTPEPTESLKTFTITGENAGEILALAERTGLESVDATASTEYEALLELHTLLPDCEIVWNVPLYGKTVKSTDSEIVLSAEDTELEELMTALKYLPSIKSVDMHALELTTEQADPLIAAYPEVDFGFYVNFAKWTVSSEITCFSTQGNGYGAYRYTSEELAPLFKYCDELVALDLGHNNLTDISGFDNLDELKVLILVDNPNLKDMSPIGELSELEYLEFFLNPGVEDFTCLSRLTKLTDINLGYTKLSDIAFLENMPALERAWLRGTAIPQEMWAEAKANYPNVEFLFAHNSMASSTSGSWRASDRNVAIRQAFTNWELIEDFVSWDEVHYLEGAAIKIAEPIYEN